MPEKLKKILVIDDEKNIQVSLASILEDEGYLVYLSSTGEEGLEKFKNLKPDAVFLDIWLPGIDGLEVMNQMLEVEPLQIIIMMSGHGNITTAVKAVRDGAYDFLEKPLSLDKVIFVLKRGLSYKNLVEENERLKKILKQEILENGKEKSNEEKSGNIVYQTKDIKNSRKQKTINKSLIFYGIGLHSGEKTGLAIRPMGPGKGIRFENISENGYIPARVEFLDTTNYATSIRKDGLIANTIEHFMATLHAFGITNLSIKISKEVPIDDGSAVKFCNLIRESGIVEQSEIIPEINITKTHIIGIESEITKYIKIEPYDGFAVKYTLIYDEPLGKMAYEFNMDSPESFEREIAPARTYGFVDDFHKLADMGLAEGGRLNNFILIDNGKILNTKLRFPEELARHKILDIIGDFYLLGRPIRGKITAQKTGHFDNSKMVNLIKEEYC